MLLGKLWRTKKDGRSRDGAGDETSGWGVLGPQVQALQSRVKSLTTNNALLEQECAELHDKVGTMGDELRRLRAELSELEELRTTNQTIESQLIEANARIARLKAGLPDIIPKPAPEQPTPSEQRCCIDLEPFKPGDIMVRLPCFHVHHSKCLLPYLRRMSNPECPICRTKIEPEAVDSLPLWRWQH